MHETDGPGHVDSNCDCRPDRATTEHVTICRKTPPRVDQQYSGSGVSRRQPFSKSESSILFRRMFDARCRSERSLCIAYICLEPEQWVLATQKQPDRAVVVCKPAACGTTLALAADVVELNEHKQ